MCCGMRGVGWGRRGAGRPKVVWTVPGLRGRGASLCPWPRSRLPHRRLALALQDDHCGIYSCRKGATSWPSAWHGAGSSQRSPSPPPAPALALDLCFHFPPNVYSFIHSFIPCEVVPLPGTGASPERVEPGTGASAPPAGLGAQRGVHRGAQGPSFLHPWAAGGRGSGPLFKEAHPASRQWRAVARELRAHAGTRAETTRWWPDSAVGCTHAAALHPAGPPRSAGSRVQRKTLAEPGFWCEPQDLRAAPPACAGPLAMRPLCSGVITSDFSYVAHPPGSHHSHTCQTSCLLPFPAAPEDVSPRPALTRGRVLQLLLSPHPAVSFLSSSSLRSCTC